MGAGSTRAELQAYFAAQRAAEAQNEYAIEEGVRSAAGVGVPKPGGKWGGGLEEFGVDLKGNPIKTSGYAFMP